MTTFGIGCRVKQTLFQTFSRETIYEKIRRFRETNGLNRGVGGVFCGVNAHPHSQIHAVTWGGWFAGLQVKSPTVAGKICTVLRKSRASARPSPGGRSRGRCPPS
ncbi:hypothetical protein Rcae01_04453 [Novipirellula caenicola]|uniref:Uncharacterized protein n=1 Tax=Novipirellula caenicola TaxID=1536901 RepID=A0ABP9VV16_9BACT